MTNAIKSSLKQFTFLTSLYRNVRDLCDRRGRDQPTPWGFTLAGNDEMAGGSFEPVETEVVRRILTEVDILVNVGANVGYYCCHALSMGKPVVAIEPNARNVHYLLRNISTNGWAQRAEVFPVAVGRSADVLNFWGSGTGASLIRGWANIPDDYVTQVPVLSLDRVLGDTLSGRKSLVLVDIEGAEFMMLEGARQILLNEPRPMWLMEITTTENQPGEVKFNPQFVETFKCFFDCGYRAFNANDPVMEVTLQMVEEVVLGRQRLSTHNFIFQFLEP